MAAKRKKRPHGWPRLPTGPKAHYLKSALIMRLAETMKAMHLTQLSAAKRLGTTQPELSKILSGKFSEASLERLMRFLAALGHHVEIRVGDARGPGRVTVRDGSARKAS
jgi:predicted XRE-type DNA-binding protein